MAARSIRIPHRKGSEETIREDTREQRGHRIVQVRLDLKHSFHMKFRLALPSEEKVSLSIYKERRRLPSRERIKSLFCRSGYNSLQH